MTSVTNCRPGELLIQAPQCEIEKFIAEAESWPGLKVVRQQNSQSRPSLAGNEIVYNGAKPTPLGIPMLNFRRVEKVETKPAQTAVQNRRTDGKPHPLGIPRLVF